MSVCTSEGPGPFPGVLDLWGGGGKLVEYRAALLAAHGFASMAIDYMTPKVTMETGKMVGNDYLEVKRDHFIYFILLLHLKFTTTPV